MMQPQHYIASFDSASAMLRAVARYLHGQDFPVLGTQPAWMLPLLEPLAAAVNALPPRLRDQVYIWSGWCEAISPEKLGQVRAQDIARWAAQHYPRRRYPAAMIGSSNGALAHLAVALGIPWLPQTVFIPVARSGVDPDEPVQDMAWGRAPGRRLLDANPDLALHHMHDPNQDRLMVQRMTYFRVKLLRLGAAYTRFLEETLEPGGTIFIVECERSWPVTTVGERHFFQFGAVGALEPDEYQQGSARVAEYLRRYGSHRRRWHPPAPDTVQPEAEWGFAPQLGADIERLARHRGYRVRRIVFGQPEDPSPLIADLYRWWYRQRGIPANRLLAESFIVMEPYWALRTGSAPYWAVFGTEPSADRLEAYLRTASPYDFINLMLFSHGTEGAGVAPATRWRELLALARVAGGFIGVDKQKFPRDFATFVRYNPDLQRRIPARYPLPGPLALAQLDAFLREHGDRYPVRWIDGPAAGGRGEAQAA